MFNLYKFEQTSRDDNKMSNLTDVSSFRNEKYKERRASLANKYRQRMAKFIAKLSSDQYIHSYCKFQVKDDFITRIKNNPYGDHGSNENKSFRTTFKTEKERISNHLNNVNYDTTPSPDPFKSFELRPRMPEKEIGDAKIRYKPKFLVERVADKVKENSFIFADDNPRSHSISPMSRLRNISRLNDYSVTSNHTSGGSSHLSAKLTPKSILPHLHVKTHFKGAATFTLSYPENYYCPSTKSLSGQTSKDRDLNKNDKERSNTRLLFNAFKNIESKYSLK